MPSAEESVHGFITDPASASGLDLRELAAIAPQPDQALVDVRAFAINRGELALLSQRTDGWRPGQDFAGVVRAEAQDRTGPAAGARVVGLADGGAWSRRVAVPTSRLALLPETVSFEDAAALPVAGLTALRALRLGGSLVGRRVLVTGASGGVGTFAVQLARVGGAHVTAQVSALHRVDAVQALGAEQVTVEVNADVGPFDLVLEAVGGQVLADAIHRLVPSGTVVAYGMASGERTPLAFADFAQGSLSRLVGFFVYATERKEPFGADLETLAGLLGAGRLRVEGPARYDWTQTPQALEQLRRRQVTGKVVLSID